MNHRACASIGVLGTVVVCMSLMVSPVAGPTVLGSYVMVVSASSEGAQLSSVTVKTTPEMDLRRTPWGDPNFQGLWTGSTMTPLERSTKLAERQFLSEEEVVALEAQADQRRFVERAPGAGEPSTYNTGLV